METLQKEAFESELMQFIGTEHWYEHSLVPAMTYTDGVKYFAEQAESYWLLDVIATEYYPMLTEQPFLFITVESKNGSCDIFVKDGNNEELKSKHVSLTTLIEGTWNFYLFNDVLLLPSEY
ncbi:MAG: hypothetical protein Q8S55_09500 [Methylococcaceae bacterium]|nr:hypothetical protein [Methylococcaceae bacterium]